jgi:uncharacterized protein YlzI (FlbEa/FlbD family)
MNSKMLLTFTEILSGEPIAINPNKVISVFTIKQSEDVEEQQYVGETIIVLEGSNVIVAEPYDEVVGRLNGELNNMISFYDRQNRIFTANV